MYVWERVVGYGDSRPTCACTDVQDSSAVCLERRKVQVAVSEEHDGMVFHVFAIELDLVVGEHVLAGAVGVVPPTMLEAVLVNATR